MILIVLLLTPDISPQLAQPVNGTLNKNRTVRMFWCDRYGDSTGCSTHSNVAVAAALSQDDPRISPVTERLGYRFINYQFAVKIDPSKSISLFWFEKDEHDGSAPMGIDNEGVGYRLDQDHILYAPELSQLDFRGSDETAKVYHIVAAVS